QYQLARQEEAARGLAEQNEHQAQEAARTEKGLRETAERERQRAEANLAEAQTAVKELTTVGQLRLAAVQHMEGVSRALLENALAFHERFLSINGDDPGRRAEVGGAQLKVADIQEKLARPGAAEKAYRQALAVFQQLADEVPERDEYRLEQAKAWNGLAILQ